MAVIVITGGTAGVGKATALHFAKAGYDVGIIARDDHSLEATKRELLRYGVRVHTVEADVAHADALLAVPLTLSLDTLRERLEDLADDLMVELVLDAS